MPAARIARRSSGVTGSAAVVIGMRRDRKMASAMRLNTHTSGNSSFSASTGNQPTASATLSGDCMAMRFGSRSANSTNSPVTRQKPSTEASCNACAGPIPKPTRIVESGGAISQSLAMPPSTPTAFRQICSTVTTWPALRLSARKRIARTSPASARVRSRPSRAAANEISDSAIRMLNPISARTAIRPSSKVMGRFPLRSRRCARADSLSRAQRLQSSGRPRHAYIQDADLLFRGVVSHIFIGRNVAHQPAKDQSS